MGSVLGVTQRNRTSNVVWLWTEFLGLPDCSSEAVLQRRGAHIKDVDLGEPGVDTGHLSRQRTVRLETKHLLGSAKYRRRVSDSTAYLAGDYRSYIG